MVVEMMLKREGDDVVGHYTFGLGFGSLEGRVTEDTLHFKCECANNYVCGIFESRKDDGFTGTWGYQHERSGAGIWNGQRE